MSFHRLDFKIVLAIVVCAILSFAAVAFLDISRQAKSTIAKEKESLMSIGTLLQKHIETAMLSGQRQDIKSAVDALKKYSSFEDIRVLDETGKIKVALDENAVGTVVPVPKIQEQEGRRFSFSLTVQNMPKCFRCHDKKKSVLGYIQFKTSLEAAYQALFKEQVRHLFIAGSTLVILCLLIFAIIRFSIGIPVRHIIQKMEKVSEGDFQTRISGKISGELGEITRSFNSMAAQLERDREEIDNLRQQRISQVDRLASLGELSASLAHEIRNPLTSVGSSIRVIHRETPVENPHHPILGEILKQIDRLGKAVNSLLNYARLPSPSLTNSNLSVIMERVLLLTRRQLENQKVRVTKDVPAGVPKVMVDEGQVEQVFLNLILNAIQAMPGGGAITIELRHAQEDHAVEVKIQDTGIGIAPENLTSIFRPFFTTRPKGSGLGLAIAKRIIEMHHGRIDVESRPGQGTLFRIRLPLNSMEE